MGRALASAAAVLAAALVALAAAAAARAHLSSYPYALKACPASYENQVDPVTVLFTNAGWASRALNHIEFHTGWSNESGATHRFQSHGVCGDMYGQRASGGLFSSRYHVRVRKTYHEDDLYGITSLATPHHEDLMWCGHAVDENGPDGSGFDMGRRRLTDLMGVSEYHGSVLKYWGNDRDFRQCDGDYAGSNGWVRYIRIPDWNH